MSPCLIEVSCNWKCIAYVNDPSSLRGGLHNRRWNVDSSNTFLFNQARIKFKNNRLHGLMRSMTHVGRSLIGRELRTSSGGVGVDLAIVNSSRRFSFCFLEFISSTVVFRKQNILRVSGTYFPVVQPFLLFSLMNMRKKGEIVFVSCSFGASGSSTFSQ